MNIVNSVASLSISATTQASGLVGRLNGYGAIYTAYFYGLINATNQNAITQIYANSNSKNPLTNRAYNDVYAIFGEELQNIDQINQAFTISNGNIIITQNSGFTIDTPATDYNNGYPYIKYGEAKLVSVIPTIIQINQAFTTQHLNSNMFVENIYGDYVKYKYGI